MHAREFGRFCAKVSLAATLSGSLIATTVPFVPAYADPESELADAKARLEAIGAEYQQLQSELSETTMALETTKGRIEQTQIELSEAQVLLAANVSEEYKGGGSQALDALLGATSFDDLVSRVFYMNKVSDAQAEAIEDVQTLKDQLEDEQAEQEKRIAETQEKVDEAAANQQSAQALVNSLSAEVQEQLAAEAAANEALAAAMQAADDAQNSSLDDVEVSAPPAQDVPSDEGSNGGSENQGPTDNGDSNTGGTTDNGSNGGSDSGSNNNQGGGTSTVGGAALSFALTKEGAPYSYGAAGPSSFDCSGLVYWSYAQLGISIPRSSYAQMDYIQAHGRWTTNVSELQYGDLVFYPGHVAFYVGGGQVFGAWTYGHNAGYGSVYACGTPLGGGNI